MSISQKSLHGLETDSSLLKSWSLSSHKVDKSFGDLKKNGKSQEIGKRDRDSPRRTFDNHSHVEDTHDIILGLETDRRFNVNNDSPTKLVPMPYFGNSKEKRTLYTPFKWQFNNDLATQVSKSSLHVIREVNVSSKDDNPGERYYQIQPNEEKINTIKDEIELAFGLYYRLLLASRISVNYSVEVNRLKQCMNDIASQIPLEREIFYDSSSESLFINNTLGLSTYQDYQSILKPIIIEKMIPALTKLKKEFFAMEYLSGEHKNLEEQLGFLIYEINRTIIVIGQMKKQIDREGRISSAGEREAIRLEKVKQPIDLQILFIELAIKIATLYSETIRFAKLRRLFKNYLKALVVIEVYGPEESKLNDLRRRLTAINVLLRKKAETQDEYYQISRRTQSVTMERDCIVEPLSFEFVRVIEGDDCLDENVINHMKDHIQRTEKFTKLAEVFYEENRLAKTQKKVVKMHSDSGIYLEQIEKVIKGIEFARHVRDQIKPVVEEDYNEETPELIEKRTMANFNDMISQIQQSNVFMDDNSWKSTDVAAALEKALAFELESKLIGKSKHKSIAFEKKKIITKLAAIIRRRTNDKNRIFTSSRSRVESNLTIQDTLKLIMSKRVWEAMASPSSNVVCLKGNILGSNKMVNHKIYCNPELDCHIMKVLRFFVFCLAEKVPKPLHS